MDALDDFFDISGQQSSVGTEVRAGVTTFLTMSYILFVNPETRGVGGTCTFRWRRGTCGAEGHGMSLQM